MLYELYESKFELFEEALETNRILDATHVIRDIFDILHVTSVNQFLHPEIRKEYRNGIYDELQQIANKHDFQFKMGFVIKECDKIEWYYKGIRIAPINGIIKPFTTKNTPITRKRNPINPALRHEVFHRDGYRCLECGATNKDIQLEIDHITPVTQGGTDELNNLQTLCMTCNRAKNNRAWTAGQI